MRSFLHNQNWANLLLTPISTKPHKEILSKRFIPEIMFTCGTAKPLYDTSVDCVFDGNINIFLFMTQELTLRSSKNRKKGRNGYLASSVNYKGTPDTNGDMIK